MLFFSFEKWSCPGFGEGGPAEGGVSLTQLKLTSLQLIHFPFSKYKLSSFL